jgi:hypothetical protein
MAVNIERNVNYRGGKKFKLILFGSEHDVEARGSVVVKALQTRRSQVRIPMR